MKRPEISEIKKLELPKIESMSLSNGSMFYFLDDSQAKYLRFEIVFEAGRLNEDSPLAAKGAALLIKEGTKTLSGRELAEYFDSKGSALQIRNSLDHIFISFVCLKEYAIDLIHMTAKVCFEPSLSELELLKMVKRQKQKLNNETSKTEVVAYREMTAHIFGHDNPYGYNSTPSLYDQLRIEDIREFHKNHITKGSFQLFLTGFVNDEVIKAISTSFGKTPMSSNSAPHHKVIVKTHPEVNEVILEGSVQSSLRLYKPLFNRHHPDFSGLFLLNLIFGGYFGSRLMKNIREKEGLTYGIYSGIDPLKNSGYFYISTETRHSNIALVQKLINEELDVLSTTPILSDELVMVQRYLAGQFLRMIDGPLNVMKVCRTLILDGLELDFYDQMLTKIWATGADELMSLANHHLSKESMSVLIVGAATDS